MHWWLFKVPPHLSAGFRSRLGHTKTRTSEVDMLLCFRPLSCCITQQRLTMDWSLNIPLQYFLVGSWIHASLNYGKSPGPWSSKASPPSHYLYHVWLWAWHCVCGKSCNARCLVASVRHTFVLLLIKRFFIYIALFIYEMQLKVLHIGD